MLTLELPDFAFIIGQTTDSVDDMIQLTHTSLLRISGDDATTFLQGQLTNDVEQLDKRWQFTGYCNPKGRLLATLQLWRGNEGYYALVDSSIVDSVSQRLRMYVLRSKVSIEHLETASVSAGIGQIDETTLNQLTSFTGQDAAAMPVGSERFDCFTYARGDSPDGLFILSYGNRQLFVAPAGLALADDHTPMPESDWQSADIEDAIARITAPTQELFVAQMVNLDLIDGINFKKGCYTGQEIVARMHYLGNLKQRMFVCDTDGAEAATAGSKIMTLEGKNAGQLASDVIAGRALAVLRLEHQQDSLQIDGGGVLTVAAQQPYSV